VLALGLLLLQWKPVRWVANGSPVRL